MKISLIDRLFGCVSFELWGEYPEDFINLAAAEGIELWNLKREKDVLYATARLWQIKDVKNLAKKCRLVYTEKEERGLVKTVKNYRFRYGLAAGAVILCVFVFLSSRFLWRVNVTGCNLIDETKLEEKLAEYGIKIGGKAVRHDLDDVQLKLLRDFSELAFISINIKGSSAEIEVTERKIPPETIDQYDPCNIVASKSGQIVSVRVYSGVTLCKKDEVVSKGQLLVSGIFDSKYVGFRMVHAKADIKALTEEKITSEKYYNYEAQERTGNEKTYYTFNVLGLSFTFPFGSCPFSESETENEEKTLRIGDGFYLPMSLEKTTYYETSPVNKTRTPKEAEEEARREAEEKLRIFKTHTNIENCEEEILKDGEKVSVSFYCTVLENIAAEKEIFRE